VSSDSAEKTNPAADKTRKSPALNLQVPTAESLRNRMLYQQVIRIVSQEIWER
jgi:hypothetical protein